MRTRSCCLILVPALLVHPLAVAQVGTEIPASAEAPGADARERGLAAIQAGHHFTAAAAFREAAGLGDAVAMRCIGDLALAGTGVAQSYEQAIHWYCQAALGGNLEAVDRLEAVDLGSWSTRRNAQGWEPACKEWVMPKPPPQFAQVSNDPAGSPYPPPPNRGFPT